MMRLTFTQTSPGYWRATTPFDSHYTIHEIAGQWYWSYNHLPNRAEDFAHAADCCRADFEERVEACLAAPDALRRATDTIRRAERIARSDPKQSLVFENLLQLARVAVMKETE